MADDRVERTRGEVVVGDSRDRPGERGGKMGRDEREVGRGWCGVGVGRKLCRRCCVVEDDEVAVVDGVGESITSGVAERRPVTVMTIEVTKDKSVSRGMIEEGREIRSINIWQ